MREPQPTTPAGSERELETLRAVLERLRASLATTFLGQDQVVEELILGLLGGGHVLLEGVPGVGKTTLVRTLAGALDADFRRIQFTPDLMPADVLGTRVLEEGPEGGRRFTFQAGPIFANVVLADEINRATPRTQSALLEAMQERSVTVFGDTLELPEPFFVIATENPIEMEGTFPLPEAQIDRFLLKVCVEPPGADELVAILTATTGAARPVSPAVIGMADLLRLQQIVREVPTSSEIMRLVSQLVLSSHPGSAEAPDLVRNHVRHGASPRGGQAILLAARARALLHGRLHVAEEDLSAVGRPALRHRLLLNYEAEATGVEPDRIVAELLEHVF